MYVYLTISFLVLCCQISLPFIAIESISSLSGSDSLPRQTLSAFIQLTLLGKKLLGNKISRIRKLKGYSQMQFAEMLGVSTNALSLIETGNGFLTAETPEKVLDKLNLEPDELFSFDINCE